MTDKDFHTLFSAAVEETDCERYLAEWSTSTIFLLHPDKDWDGVDAVVDTLHGIWDAAHRTSKEIREATGLTQVQFAEMICAPRRTIEGWEARSNCLPYIRLMLQQLLGIYTRPDKDDR